MRLDETTRRFIIDTVKQVFSPDSEVWLFGSRVDDHARGGDIDLYIETPDLPDPVKRRIDFKVQLSEHLGEQKVDVVVHNRTRPLQPIHVIAKDEGINLETYGYV